MNLSEQGIAPDLSVSARYQLWLVESVQGDSPTGFAYAILQDISSQGQLAGS